MSFDKDQLNNNEKIILDLRPHWWFFIRHIIVLVLVAAICIALLVTSAPVLLLGVAAVGLLAALVWFGSRYLVWKTTNFVVTTDRLISRDGVLARQGIEIPLERVNNVLFSQTLFERLIGSGDLEIESAGEQGSQAFSNIRKPLNVQNEIYKQMEDNENRKFDRVSNNLTTSESTQDIPEQIEKLDDLRKRGVISESDFEEKKDELLKRL